MNNKYLILLSVFLFISVFQDLKGQVEKDSVLIKNKYAPDNLRFQFAGNAGLVSAGADWLILNEKVEMGLTLGIVPKTTYSKTFYSTTLKAIYSPSWSVDYKNFSWQPVSFGGIISRYSGLDFSNYQDNDYYPDGYYWWGIKNRFGVTLDTEVNMKLARGPFSNISLYLEASIWDVYFYSVYANNNDTYLNINDLLVMGNGLKLFFRKK